MSASEMEIFGSTLQKTHLWLDDLMGELGWEDRHKAYLALRAVLHTLRDRLTVEEAAHLGAQLPMLVRGFYYEGWDPTGKPRKERHRDDFFLHVKGYFKKNDAVSAEKIVRAVFALLAKHVTGGEIDDVKHVLPSELRVLWS